MNLFSFPVRLLLAFRLAALAMWLVWTTSSAQITLESGIGHQGEMQYRAGYTFQIAQHWQLDSGFSAVRYKDEHSDYHQSMGPSGHIFAADAVLLRQIDLGGSLYLVLGSGPAVWNHASFGAQRHGHAWMFSNRIALEWIATPKITLGIGARHYSCLWCRPNSSIDFLGLQGTWRF